MFRDEWHVLDPFNRLIAEIKEETGRALARRLVPMGQLIPEKVILSLGGHPVAEINQKFKIIGDIWEMSCTAIPPQFDRRVLIAVMILMGMVERKRK